MMLLLHRFASKLKSLLESRDGNFALTFALLLIPLVSAAGLAVDYSQLTHQRSQLQEALDAATLAALSPETMSDADRIKLAEQYFLSNAQNPCTTKPNVTIANTNDRVDASAGCMVHMAFVGILGFKSLPINAIAAAKKSVSAGGMPMCVIALNPTMDKALLESGGSVWDAQNCKVQVNSASAKAVILSGGSSLKAGENCFVGKVGQGLSMVSPPPTPDCKPVVDPFADITKPSVTSCDYTDFNKDVSMTVYPGVYCGGLRLSNSVFTMKPGLYIIMDGIFESSGGATIKGDGVTIFLTGVDAGIVWSGGGTYQLSAMKTGPLAGFVVFLDPKSTPEKKSVISGGGDTRYEGVMYFPNQHLVVSGGGSAVANSPFTAFVADSFEFSGGSTLVIKIDPSKTSVPIPGGLYGTKVSTAPYLIY